MDLSLLRIDGAPARQKRAFLAQVAIPLFCVNLRILFYNEKNCHSVPGKTGSLYLQEQTFQDGYNQRG